MSLNLFILKIKNSISNTLAHRGTSLLVVVFGLIFIFIEYISGYIYFINNDNLLGISKEQYFLFVSFFNMVSYTYQFFFIGSHETLSENILEGELDYIFIRPVNSYIYYAFNDIDFPSLIGLLVSIVLFIHFYPLLPSFLDVVYILISYLLAVSMLFLINQILVTMLFWFEKASQLTSVSEYIYDFCSRPKNFFPNFIKVLFTRFVPILTATSLITDKLNGTLNIFDLCYLVLFDIVCLSVSLLLWK